MTDIEAQLDRAFAPLAAAIEAGRIPGGVLGVVDRNGDRAVRAMGQAQTVPSSRPMTEDTWFDLASLTKVLFTTERILALAESGHIDLDAPLTSVLPDFRHYNLDNWERKITFRQCLGHQTPFPAVFPLYTYGRDPDLLRTFLLQHEFAAGPSVYSDINFILLGLALERLEGKWIREQDPGKGFAWSAEPDNAAATEDCYWRHRVLVGEVHDDNCSALQGAGHAGLFGTASSVLAFAASKLSAAGSDALIRTPLSARRTHGWERPYEGWSGGEHCSPQTIGHTGFTGTGLWIDFDRGHAWTLLTNRVHPTRHFDSGIIALRRAVGDCINVA
ncbi:CubicO group peptidase (beta-lactamase class C family) [Devosia subaequoris]|uniref:CubicO group peptidase (Beta-lactamase class C family) n=1 Tax=Devosia subaequoris TaxID=395930 RepID=A0A7W6INP4_9HYPH|nr:serine hydrolase domain-containing protein [Devosia subaequoris]MBB4052985.1 CubicO group peptidase (beta-lactamase class C family) [Devosia subaequoris]MCP1210404.1 beta-lactamase family protein [Devosia subaequoris]